MNAVVECRADAHQSSGERRFGVPFQSGHDPRRNAGGRPAIGKVAAKLIGDVAEDVVRRVITAALNGDMYACKMLMDRLVPVPKGRPVQFELPARITDAMGIAKGVEAVLRAIAEAELTPDEGATIASVLELHRRAMATHELEAQCKNLLVQLNALRGPR